MDNKKLIPIIIAALVIAGAVALRYFYSGTGTPAPVVTEQGAKPAEQAGPADLGAAIFEQTANPVQDKLPEAVAPVQNPIQEIYKNPFQ